MPSAPQQRADPKRSVAFKRICKATVQRFSSEHRRGEKASTYFSFEQPRPSPFRRRPWGASTSSADGHGPVRFDEVSDLRKREGCQKE